MSQFWASLWGFEKRNVRLGKGVWGIVVGCVVGIAWVIGMVMRKGLDGGRDAWSWAWIDLVSSFAGSAHFLRAAILCIHCVKWKMRWLTEGTPGLRGWLRQAGRHRGEIRPTGVGELSAEVYGWLEHRSDPAGCRWRCFVNCTARD